MNNNTTISQNDDGWASAISAIVAVDFVLLVFAMLFHSIAAILQLTTMKSKRKNTNQSLLLIHLSFVSFFCIATNVWAVFIQGYGMRGGRDFVVTYYVAYLAYVANLIFLTLDRLLFVLLNLKYTKYVNKYVVGIVICVMWMVSIVYALVLKYAKFDRATYFTYSHHVYNGFTTAFAVAAYLTIFVKVFLSARVSSSSSIQQQKSKKILKKFLLPFAIVMTFFLFNYLPGILTAHVTFKEEGRTKLFVIGLIGVNILNLVSDPLFYVFLQPKIKRKLRMYVAKLLGTTTTMIVSSSKSSRVASTTNAGFEMT